MSIDPRSIDPRAFGVAGPSDDRDDGQARAEDAARERWRLDAGARSLGLRLDEVGPRRAVMVFTARDAHLDGGTLRAGFVFALAEACLGYASGHRGAAGSWQMEGLATVGEGTALRAEAQPHPMAPAGGDVGAELFEVRITTATGSPVALVQARLRADANVAPTAPKTPDALAGARDPDA